MVADGYWLNNLTTLMSIVALAPFVGNTMYGKVFSPVNVLLAHEIIKQAFKFSSGFKLDDAAVGLSDILERGRGGDFLSTRLTRKHVRSAFYSPDMYPRISLNNWQALGQPDAMVLLKEYTCELLKTLSVPSDHQELINKGEAFYSFDGWLDHPS